MDLVSNLSSAKLKDKRNRVLERETNELKDELCAMRHIVHLLDNIKRVSSDCISFLHLMVEAALKTDNLELDQLRDDVQELEEELKVWERKYQMMSNMQTMPSMDNNNKTIIKSINNNSNHKIVINSNNNTINTNNSNNNNVNDNEVNDVDGYEVCGDESYYDSDKNEDCAQSSSHNSLVLMPQELCEMSMETNENDQIVITNANANTPPPVSSSSSQLSSSLLSSGLQLSSGKSLFECDWIGCDFRTNMRQRLVMHKRLHAGEMLFSCDVPGCGYQSNYKGNIKIHKKHRHRIDSDDNKEYSTPHTLNNSSSTNLSNHLTKSNNFASNMIRKRKRKKKFRFTMQRSNAALKPSIIGGLRDGSGDESAKEERNDHMSTLFTCNVKGCNYRSKWKQCLTAHQLLHAGVKPFKCDHPGCNYRTNFKGNVNVHKRVHRESQFQCQVSGCQFSTPWKNSFNQHQRNHFINTETTINIDNHIEVIDEHNTNENEFHYEVDEDDDEDGDESDGQEDNADRTVRRREPAMPLIPVQHIQTSPMSTKDFTATQHNSEMNSTHAQHTLVPPLAGVIKTEVSSFADLV